MYREQKDMSLGLGNTNGEEWWVCALHLTIQSFMTDIGLI